MPKIAQQSVCHMQNGQLVQIFVLDLDYDAEKSETKQKKNLFSPSLDDSISYERAIKANGSDKYSVWERVESRGDFYSFFHRHFFLFVVHLSISFFFRFSSCFEQQQKTQKEKKNWIFFFGRKKLHFNQRNSLTDRKLNK